RVIISARSSAWTPSHGAAIVTSDGACAGRGARSADIEPHRRRMMPDAPPVGERVDDPQSGVVQEVAGLDALPRARAPDLDVDAAADPPDHDVHLFCG